MSDYIKYPRTVHLPWSESVSEDDIVSSGPSVFDGKKVIVTEKMDGENTSFYNSGYHARSINETTHPSRDFVKKIWGEIRHEIPDGFRICGENLYAKHSIHYKDLASYFLVFSVWNELTCLCWEETVEYAKLLGLLTVPVLYEGIYNEKLIKALSLDKTKQEGYVVRLSSSFEYKDFSTSMAKYVRKNHVATDKHWKLQEITPNELAKSK